jgi:hypothetical protein
MAGQGLPTEHLDRLIVAPADREAAVSAWRRAEGLIYPSVMINAGLYQQYLGIVRAIVDDLADVHTEDDLVTAWTERVQIGREAISRAAPTFGPMMDPEAVRDAAFCQRHRDITREHGKELARERLELARRQGDPWVVLFEDVTPFGSHRLEMHVRSGRAIHASSRLEPDGTSAAFELEVVQLDPRDGAWLLDRPPVVPSRKFTDPAEWQARISEARAHFGKDP